MSEAGRSGPWYQQYFGPDYLRIYRLRDTPEQLQFLRRVLPRPAGAGRVLDLPCGHGRHTVEIASWGYRVVGLDLNDYFLHVARRDAARSKSRPALLRGDMRCFPFADAVFDTAICMFTSLGYFHDDAEHQRVLDEFARVLRPGARFVLDLANIDAVRRQPPTARWRKDGVSVDSEYLWDEATKRAVTRRRARFEDGREAFYESSVRLFEGHEIEAMLTAAGFGVDEVLGDYDGRRLSPERPRRILLARARSGA